jgi:alkylation response protein AidB-like acyl-CoA dehydrogenase
VASIWQVLGAVASTRDYLGGAVLAVGALNALQPSELRDELLSGIGAGAVRTALVTGSFAYDGENITGRADFAPDAADADRLLIVADDGAGRPVLVVTAGSTVTPRPILDETRRLATVAAKALPVTGADVLRFDGDARLAAARLADRAAVAVACDSLGVAAAMLTATVEYTKVRNQFGRPIGSFQAVKHACADMYVRIAVARQLVSAAVQAVADGRDDDPAVSMAKSYASSAAVDAAGKAMQLHGGIGYTWESGIHVYLKRAVANRSLFGSPADHRKKLARRYVETTQGD